uniref:Uncharacterized protein n=1 Tax=Chromera velia CCMP2878 TaxID=1169474 RepID=A0A0G4GJW9_9ALVE|eukprot:Cvel_22230.t1-p1 / transcript=Cvel_22230.t1 / gene=Cvel_22230 / organism=Chromera_velia_CCMP2878 / gene_product=hypothetical protein / transcript_product=hypothetical protein / location=Cvel_scaffold2163:18141-25761(+) / protein_length=1884 / sequence_SO=supercontig / SO=protein_coding / is_pseudo=false
MQAGQFVGAAVFLLVPLLVDAFVHLQPRLCSPGCVSLLSEVPSPSPLLPPRGTCALGVKAQQQPRSIVSAAVAGNSGSFRKDEHAGEGLKHPKRQAAKTKQVEEETAEEEEREGEAEDLESLFSLEDPPSPIPLSDRPTVPSSPIPSFLREKGGGEDSSVGETQKETATGRVLEALVWMNRERVRERAGDLDRVRKKQRKKREWKRKVVAEIFQDSKFLKALQQARAEVQQWALSLAAREGGAPPASSLFPSSSSLVELLSETLRFSQETVPSFDESFRVGERLSQLLRRSSSPSLKGVRPSSPEEREKDRLLAKKERETSEVWGRKEGAEKVLLFLPSDETIEGEKESGNTTDKRNAEEEDKNRAVEEREKREEGIGESVEEVLTSFLLSLLEAIGLLGPSGGPEVEMVKDETIEELSARLLTLFESASTAPDMNSTSPKHAQNSLKRLLNPLAEVIGAAVLSRVRGRLSRWNEIGPRLAAHLRDGTSVPSPLLPSGFGPFGAALSLRVLWEGGRLDLPVQLLCTFVTRAGKEALRSLTDRLLDALGSVVWGSDWEEGRKRVEDEAFRDWGQEGNQNEPPLLSYSELAEAMRMCVMLQGLLLRLSQRGVETFNRCEKMVRSFEEIVANGFSALSQSARQSGSSRKKKEERGLAHAATQGDDQLALLVASLLFSFLKMKSELPIRFLDSRAEVYPLLRWTTGGSFRLLCVSEDVLTRTLPMLNPSECAEYVSRLLYAYCPGEGPRLERRTVASLPPDLKRRVDQSLQRQRGEAGLKKKGGEEEEEESGRRMGDLLSGSLRFGPLLADRLFASSEGLSPSPSVSLNGRESSQLLCGMKFFRESSRLEAGLTTPKDQLKALSDADRRVFSLSAEDRSREEKILYGLLQNVMGEFFDSPPDPPEGSEQKEGRGSTGDKKREADKNGRKNERGADVASLESVIEACSSAAVLGGPSEALCPLVAFLSRLLETPVSVSVAAVSEGLPVSVETASPSMTPPTAPPKEEAEMAPLLLQSQGGSPPASGGLLNLTFQPGEEIVAETFLKKRAAARKHENKSSSRSSSRSLAKVLIRFLRVCAYTGVHSQRLLVRVLLTIERDLSLTDDWQENEWESFFVALMVLRSPLVPSVALLSRFLSFLQAVSPSPRSLQTVVDSERRVVRLMRSVWALLLFLSGNSGSFGLQRLDSPDPDDAGGEGESEREREALKRSILEAASLFVLSRSSYHFAGRGEKGRAKKREGTVSLEAEVLWADILRLFQRAPRGQRAKPSALDIYSFLVSEPPDGLGLYLGSRGTGGEAERTRGDQPAGEKETREAFMRAFGLSVDASLAARSECGRSMAGFPRASLCSHSVTLLSTEPDARQPPIQWRYHPLTKSFCEHAHKFRWKTFLERSLRTSAVGGEEGPGHKGGVGKKFPPVGGHEGEATWQVNLIRRFVRLRWLPSAFSEIEFERVGERGRGGASEQPEGPRHLVRVAFVFEDCPPVFVSSVRDWDLDFSPQGEGETSADGGRTESKKEKEEEKKEKKNESSVEKREGGEVEWSVFSDQTAFALRQRGRHVVRLSHRLWTPMSPAERRAWIANSIADVLQRDAAGQLCGPVLKDLQADGHMGGGLEESLFMTRGKGGGEGGVETSAGGDLWETVDLESVPLRSLVSACVEWQRSLRLQGEMGGAAFAEKKSESASGKEVNWSDRESVFSELLPEWDWGQFLKGAPKRFFDISPPPWISSRAETAVSLRLPPPTKVSKEGMRQHTEAENEKNRSLSRPPRKKTSRVYATSPASPLTTRKSASKESLKKDKGPEKTRKADGIEKTNQRTEAKRKSVSKESLKKKEGLKKIRKADRVEKRNEGREADIRSEGSSKKEAEKNQAFHDQGDPQKKLAVAERIAALYGW